MNTKEFSSAHEKEVAAHLNWKVVSGSGARHTYPGDLISDEWLGECKTHVAYNPKILFQFSVWDKISEEAHSKFRFPVLFVDAGKQSCKTTWCMFQNIPCLKPDIIDAPSYVKVNKNSISLDVEKMNHRLHSEVFSSFHPTIYRVDVPDKGSYFITSLDHFGRMLLGD